MHTDLFQNLGGEQILESKSNKEKIIVTNCYNCKFVGPDEKTVDSKELNEEGGINPVNKKEMERAKKADLITLPGGSKADAKNKRFCYHEEIKMYVTERMCYAYWDNEEVKRPWKKA
jgi:hypothetical protein